MSKAVIYVNDYYGDDLKYKIFKNAIPYVIVNLPDHLYLKCLFDKDARDSLFIYVEASLRSVGVNRPSISLECTRISKDIISCLSYLHDIMPCPGVTLSSLMINTTLEFDRVLVSAKDIKLKNEVLLKIRNYVHYIKLCPLDRIKLLCKYDNIIMYLYGISLLEYRYDTSRYQKSMMHGKKYTYESLESKVRTWLIQNVDSSIEPTSSLIKGTN